MKIHERLTQIAVITLTLGMGLSFVSETHAETIDFTGTSTPTFFSEPAPPYIEEGYLISPLAGNDFVGFFADGDDINGHFTSSNGTNTAYVRHMLGPVGEFYSETGFILQKEDGSPFQITSIDLAECFTSSSSLAAYWPDEIEFKGIKGPGDTLSVTFFPDHINDGVGGSADFETFNFTEDWTGLVEVKAIAKIHNNSGYDNILFTFDNIVVAGGAVNQAPVAVDSIIQTSRVLTLNAAGSYDNDGSVVSHLWTITAPSATVTELTGEIAIYNMDDYGEYIVQLVVTDNEGLESAPEIQTFTPSNTPPVANAGPDQALTVVGETVQLDGSLSSDLDGEDILSFEWEITSKPTGSTAELDDPFLEMPTFVPDEYGAYTVSLIVNDGWDASEADEVVVSFNNIKPVADAGEDQSCLINEAVVLTGSGSDENGDDLTYLWQIESKPDGSQATLQNEASVEATIIPDVPGQYTVSLTVNDGTEDSDPSLVSITVVSYTDALSSTLKEAIIAVKGLPKDQFRCKRMRKVLTRVLYINMLLANKGRYKAAYCQMTYGIMRKLDGCERNGRPDRNDWIRGCEGQEEVYPILMEAKELLAEILEL